MGFNSGLKGLNKPSGSILSLDQLSWRSRVSNLPKFGKDFTGEVFDLITVRQTVNVWYFDMFCVGRDSLFDKTTCCRQYDPEIEYRWWGGFPAPVCTGPGPHPASYTTCTGSFSWGKATGAWRWTPSLGVELKMGSRPYAPDVPSPYRCAPCAP